MAATKYYPNRTSIPNPVAGTRDNILDCLWQDEERDFRHASPEEQNQHIFHSLAMVRSWLAGGDHAE